MLSTAIAPTMAAPTPQYRPSITAAARVAAELGDHADWRTPSRVGVESQIRNSMARTAQMTQNPAGAASTGARARIAPAAETTAAMYSQVAKESLPISSPPTAQPDFRDSA